MEKKSPEVVGSPKVSTEDFCAALLKYSKQVFKKGTFEERLKYFCVDEATLDESYRLLKRIDAKNKLMPAGEAPSFTTKTPLELLQVLIAFFPLYMAWDAGRNNHCAYLCALFRCCQFV